MELKEKIFEEIPAMIIAESCGYSYITNELTKYYNCCIHTEIFKKAVEKINSYYFSSDDEYNQFLQKIITVLNDGRNGSVFFHSLKDGVEFNSKIFKIIDLENYKNNNYNYTRQFMIKNNQDKCIFDIAFFVNGLLISVLELKYPYKYQEFQEEFSRYEMRIKKFPQIFNMIQVIAASNGQPYNNKFFPEKGVIKDRGCYYTTPMTHNSAGMTFHRYESRFRKNEFCSLIGIDRQKEILKICNEHNFELINNASFQERLTAGNLTAGFINEILSPEYLINILKYTITYKDENRVKIIDTSSQLTALENIMQEMINNNKNKGIIWAPPGAGKTILMLQIRDFLKDKLKQKFPDKNIKFYSVTDEIVLMEQFAQNCISQGLNPIEIKSKRDFTNEFNSSISRGDIYLTTIQRLSEATYGGSINVFLIDEVHRSYKKNGKNIKKLYSLPGGENNYFFGFTGTPIIDKNKKTTELFGDYLLKRTSYDSILDGTTLPLKLKLAQCENESDFATKIAETYLDNIAELRNHGLPTEEINILVACSNNQQIKKISEELNTKGLHAYALTYDKSEERDIIKNKFETDKYPTKFLVVNRICTTGYDNKTIKIIYNLKNSHKWSLIQLLSRANRLYNKCKYGIVVDLNYGNTQENFEYVMSRYQEELINDEFGKDATEKTSVILFDSSKICKDTYEEINNLIPNNFLSAALTDKERVEEIKSLPLGERKKLKNLIEEFKNQYIEILINSTTGIDKELETISKNIDIIKESLDNAFRDDTSAIASSSLGSKNVAKTLFGDMECFLIQKNNLYSEKEKQIKELLSDYEMISYTDEYINIEQDEDNWVSHNIEEDKNTLSQLSDKHNNNLLSYSIDCCRILYALNKHNSLSEKIKKDLLTAIQNFLNLGTTVRTAKRFGDFMVNHYEELDIELSDILGNNWNENIFNLINNYTL